MIRVNIFIQHTRGHFIVINCLFFYSLDIFRVIIQHILPMLLYLLTFIFDTLTVIIFTGEVGAVASKTPLESSVLGDFFFGDVFGLSASNHV